IAPLGLFWLEKRFRKNYKALFWHSLLAGVVTTIISYYWILHLLVVFGGFPYFLAVFFFVLYSFGTNLRYPVFVLLYSFLRKKIKKYLFIITGFSLLCSEFFTFQLFPYYLGNLTSGNKYLIQNVEYVGVYGLSILVIIISYWLYRVLPNLLLYKMKVFKKKKFFLFHLIPTTLIFIAFLNGVYLYHKWRNEKPEFSLKVMMIQPNSPLEFRDGRFKESIEELMEKIEDLARKGANDKKPDIIVLPESAVPFFSTNNTDATNLYNRSYYERFEALMFLLAMKYKATVYFNEVDATFIDGKPSRKSQRFYNSSVVFDPNGNRKESYYKSYLLAFGEYLPFGETFPFLYELVPQVGQFLEGKKQNLLSYYKPSKELPEWNKSHLRWMDSSFMNMKSFREYYRERETENIEIGKFLPLICYEVIIPEFVRKFSKNGNPDFIVNITNDKWYGKSIETFQHLELAKIRSIEYRRWMVRSTLSGTSVYVNHLGEVLNDVYTEVESSDVYNATIDVIRKEPTFYVRFGNLIVWIFWIFCIGIFVREFWTKKED
ncbi:MAG: apolipoprotein N-acyltransferase, partial [Leptospiraceae bacterium]|nr:apolipoprotein N-acyltransferase [Leptospiraceae bacterium]